MKENNRSTISYKNSTVLKKGLIIFVPVYIVLVAISGYIYKVQSTSDLLLKKGHEIQTVSNGKTNLSSELIPIIEDIEFVAGLAERAKVDLITSETGKPIDPVLMIPDLILFAKTHKKYDQIRYVDNTGWEKIRINNTETGPQIVQPRDLQFKGNRYYLKEALGVKKGRIYFSPFDLNIENGKIEIPYKPTIRVAEPVRDKTGNVMGIVILNYLGKHLITKFEKTSRQNQTELMLLNKDGFWLKGVKKEDEWGFMQKNPQLNFKEKFPAVWTRLNGSQKGQVETMAGLFTFSTVSPLAEAVEVLNPETKVMINHSDSSGYYWKIVSFIPRSVLYAQQRVWKFYNTFFCLISFFVIGGVSWKLAWLSVIKEDNEKQLLKSKKELEYRVVERTRELEDINARLLDEVVSRKEIQLDLQVSEKKYRMLVETMPEGLLVLDREGVVTYVNDQLLRMTEYRPEDIIGKKYTIFFNKTEVEIFKNEWKKRISGVAEPYEIAWNTRKKRQIQTLVSPAIIRDETESFNGSFGIVSDITQRKKDEKSIQLNRDRLRALVELSKMEEKSEQELANFALEQGVKLTQSQGGYFHFYDEERGSILLTSWSQEVLNICESAKGTHYPLDSAGIWADCIRFKKPVFHNDYQSISEKQGYPEGHFHVTRHMSIPVYSGNRIIAIAGVGNKASPYDESDAEQLTLLMTETWRVIAKKKVEQDLFVSENRYRTLFETMGQGVVYQDRAGRIISVNQAAEKILGVPGEILLKQPEKKSERHPVGEDGTPLKPDDHPSMMALRTGRPVNNVILGVFNPKKNHHRWIKVDAVPQFLQDEKTPSSVYTVFDDITETKKAREALEASEAKHRSMMEAMDDPAYICSPDYIISYMNPAMIRWLGGDFIGRTCHSSIYLRELKCPWCTFEKIKKFEHQKYTVLNPKDRRHYNVSNSPILNADGSVSKFTIFRDITETLNLEKQLRHVQKLEAIGTLAGGIAHDFNNILFAIMGFAEISLASVNEQESVHKALQGILKSAHRAKDLVKQILTFSRQTEQEMKPIRIRLIIKEALKLLKASLPSTIEIRDNLSSNSQIMGDPTQIHQIIMNLCTNGAHAMEETGGLLTVELNDIAVDQDFVSKFINMRTGNYLHLRISDTGHGIGEGDLERIFEPFYTTKPEGKGTGLGLSLVHGIIKNHRGQISVESDPGQGSSFDVYLPILDSGSESMDFENHVEKLPGGNEKILIVDDEKPIIEITKINLNRMGYAVDGVTNSEKALEIFKRSPQDYDMVITDMTMPNMTGDTLASNLLRIRPDLPIVLMTGFSSKIDPEGYLPKGIKGILMKPVIKSDLLCMVRNILDNF
ncbi:PAS domain S-box protein [Desulfospira joergensenii]|uniref:PAS domain S-box protein n=1 Tax=Desulfospira joergensenii TaxID=53329 RepID=UPI0003B35C0F|nr:PAS domain S-box protein [Desulfospira joergensenii]